MKKTAALIFAASFQFASASLAQDGKAIYTTQKCQLCHSVAGQGNKKAPLDGVGKKLGTAEIRKWITSPKEMKADVKMKSYASLPGKDLDALVAYVSSLK